MRTAQAAERAGVNPQTLRYYERRGLLPAPARSQAGYRRYSAETVHIVRFIKRAQELGFTLSEAESLLHLADGGPEACEEANALAGQKIAELSRRITDLTRMREALVQMRSTCDRPRPDRECPLLQAIDAAG